MIRLTKYSNRKIYSPDLGEYVNLTDIAQLLQEGKTVSVTTKNGTDVTLEVIQAAFCEVFVQQGKVPLYDMLRLMRQTEETTVKYEY